MINESEICTSYRQSKDKATQIGILAELYATTPVNIRDILERNGFIVESMAAATAAITRSRKKWTRDMVEEVAQLLAGGTTLDELAQQYQTTISAIVGLQHRNKAVFERYALQHETEQQLVSPAKAVADAVQEEKSQLISEHGHRQYKPFPTSEGAKLNSVHLLISHAKSLHQNATEALKDGRDIDCAYALGELSQVLIRAKETSTQS